MADVTVKRIEEMASVRGGAFVKARASLGVTSFGMQIIDLPPGSDAYPEHDHTGDLQEEVYTALAGGGALRAGGADHPLEPGVFIRVGPAERRKVMPGADGVRLLVIGATPGASYSPPAFSEIEYEI